MTEGDFQIEFYILCTALAWIAIRGILSGQGILEFPTIAAMLGIAWIVPQGIELESNTYNTYQSGFFWLYLTGCFLFLSWGFKVGRNLELRRILRSPTKIYANYDQGRLHLAAGALTAIGHISIILMGGIDTSGMGKQWTGVITLYALLATTSGMGLCLATLTFARTRSPVSLAIAITAALPLLWAVLGGVRREQIFDLMALSAGSWYLARRTSPPRLIIVLSLFVGIILLNQIEALRKKVSAGQSLMQALTSNEIYQSFDYFNLGQGKASEIGLAQYDFWYINSTGSVEYGAEYWNSLVHQYVPAFLLGRELKESLKADSLSRRIGLGLEEGATSFGSTRTGFSDSYRSFAFLGVFVFGAIGLVFGYLYSNARVGGLAGQYYYLVLLAEGLKGITHSTAEFVSPLPFILVVSMAVLRFSRAQPRVRKSARGPSPRLDAGPPVR
ncbi:MAG: hypothetical protein JNM89_03885 [Hyphomicrobiaceae bacterium]|nr:hypothetical protein [Hyphomicrobiaceae bacterium]